MTTLIHRPLQHFREVLKLIILLASHCRPHSEECKNFTNVISSLQTSYREITVNEGIMEPLGEGRPLLTLQDLEARLVFTKCKPFVLAIPGRQWIFGKLVDGGVEKKKLNLQIELILESTLLRIQFFGSARLKMRICDREIQHENYAFISIRW